MNNSYYSEIFLKFLEKISLSDSFILYFVSISKINLKILSESIVSIFSISVDK